MSNTRYISRGKTLIGRAFSALNTIGRYAIYSAGRIAKRTRNSSYALAPARRLLTLAAFAVLLPIVALGDDTNSPLTLQNAGITPNSTIYYIQSANNSNNTWTVTGSTISTSSYSVNNTAQQFVFITENQDDNITTTNSVYVYNIGTETFIGYNNDDKAIAIATTTNPQKIYFYTSFNTSNPLAFSFSSSSYWQNVSNQSNQNEGTTNITAPPSDKVQVNTWSYLGPNAQGKVTALSNAFTSAELAAARQFLSGSYDPTTFAKQSSIKLNNGVYTIQSEDGKYLSATESGLSWSTTVPADASGQFVFYQDESTNNVYLYSVGQKKFLSLSKGTLGEFSASDKINLFTTSDSHGYTFAFGTGETWSTSSVLGSSSTSFTTDNDPAQSNRFKVTEVTGASSYSQTDANNAFTANFIEYSASSYSKQSISTPSGSVTNGKVYTLKNRDGSYLSANSSGLTTSSTTTPTINEQFLFFQNPDNTSGEEVYLYSVGQQKFVTATGGLVGATAKSGAAQMYVYTASGTQISDGKPYLAFNTSGTWDGTTALGHSLNLDPRFEVSEATLTTGTQMSNVTGYARLVYTAVTNSDNYPRVSLEDAGLDPKGVYTISSYRGTVYAQSSQSRLKKRLSDPTNAKDEQFVFFTDPTDDTKVYLYSISEEEFVTTNGASISNVNLSTGKSTQDVTGRADAMYIFLNRNAGQNNPEQYPYSISWSQNTNWGSGNVDGNLALNIRGNRNTSGNIGIDNWGGPNDDGVCVQIAKVPDATFSEEFLTKILNNGYGDAVGASTVSLETDNKVYTLQTESGGYVYASGNSVSISTAAADAATSPLSQFVLYTHTDGDVTNTYLYSVGKSQFVTSANGLGTGTTASPITFYETSDPDGYNLSICLGTDWATGHALGNGSSNDVTKSTRFKATDVTNETTHYDKDIADQAWNGTLTYTLSSLEELGIDPTKVYYLYTDVFNEDDQTVMEGSGASLNKYSRKTSAIASFVKDIENGNYPGTHFAFVVDDKDQSKIYLYNTQSQKAANSDGSMVSGTNNLQQIYVYDTHDSEYPLAISFSNEWGVASAKYIDPTQNNDVSSDNTPRPQLELRFEPITDKNYSLADALTILRGWLTTEFHYKGASGRDFKNGMQDVSEVHYYYYVNTSRSEHNGNITKTIDFTLPIMNYFGSNQAGAYEPKGYYRWYDYRTDRMPADDNRIQPYDASSTYLKQQYDKDGNNLGYLAYKVSHYDASHIGVYYTIPDEANDVSWDGDIIACDVSRYLDYANDESITNGSKFEHEPTLSIRYIYHILPAQRIADGLRDSLCNTESQINAGHNRSYTDQGVLTFGAKDIDASMNIRCDLQSIKQYYFHPLTADALQKKHVFYNENTSENPHKFDSNDFTEKIVEATGIEWRVYNSAMSKYRNLHSPGHIFGENEKAINIRVGSGSGVSTSPYHLYGGEWKDLNGNNTETEKIDIGSTCYLVGYVTNVTNGSNQKCPFYSARLNITSASPLKAEDLPTERTENYMSTNYGSTVANFQFDDENSGMTQDAPSSTVAKDCGDENVSLIPSPFSWRQYSFHYAKLKNYSRGLGYNTYMGDYSLLHGDYLLYKSYDRIPHDRTYIKSGGTQWGYFFMTDASDEARVLATQDFTGRLCTGSKIYISAWVANQVGALKSENRDQDQPELRFNLLGVEKDANGNDIFTKPLASVCSGQFKNNINNYATGNTPSNDWYQVYGVFTLPASSSVQGFTNFRIAIDNYCSSTNGADYAIDDIQVYQNNAKLTVIQIPALCEGDNTNAVDIKIKGNYETMRAITNNQTTDQTVYYRFVDENGQPKTGEGFYGKDENDNNLNDYGIATVPASIPSNYFATEVESRLKLTGNGNHTTDLFETGVDGQLEVVLVNKGFALNRDETYYVSLSVSDPNSATGPSWGSPSDICSSYSNTFQLIRQQILFADNNSTSKTIEVECGSPASYTGYAAQPLTVTAPDKTNGGLLNINNVPFYWFKGSYEQLNGNTENTFKSSEGHTLLTAIQNYLLAYGSDTYVPGTTSREYSSSNTAPKYAADGVTVVYSEADKNLIEQYLYDATNNQQGVLLLNASSSLSTLPISTDGTANTFYAIPAIIDGGKMNVNGVDYVLCNDPVELTLRGTQISVGITLGDPNVTYPNSITYRSVRIGLPQLRHMTIGKTGSLKVPIKSRSWKGTDAPDEDLKFGIRSGNDVTENVNVYISNTNDPTIDLNNTEQNKLCELTNATLAHEATTLDFHNFNTTLLHEGYWYEIALELERTNVPDEDKTSTNCAGETFLTFKIVPEYLTWDPNVSNGFNSNWNVDANWRRSTAKELNRLGDYTDYRTETNFAFLNAKNSEKGTTVRAASKVDKTLTDAAQPKTYVPMYFSKVTIPAISGRPYPMMPFILKNTNGLILRMQNDRGETATPNIQYDMMAMGSGANGGDSIYTATNFDGNICQQILFQPGGQLLKQQFLTYQKAWSEIEVPINKWNTIATVMNQTPAGDFYVPKFTARQTTPSFENIYFDQLDKVNADGVKDSINGKYRLFAATSNDRTYSRLRLPVYQRLWGLSANEYPDDGSSYDAYDSPRNMLINGDDFKEENNISDDEKTNLWTHPFNALGDESSQTEANGYYNNGFGIALRVGDDYATPSLETESSETKTKWDGAKALIRLPKSDKTFNFYKYDAATKSEVSANRPAVEVNRDHNFKLGIPYSTDENDLASETVTTPTLATDDLKYCIIGNPYTSAISVDEFIAANTGSMETVTRDNAETYCVWVMEDNVLKEYQRGGGNRIKIGQSFFVKAEKPGTSKFTFTSNMQVDPNLSATAQARAASIAPSRIYTVENPTQVRDIITATEIGIRAWSPRSGVLTVQSGSKAIIRIMVYRADGALVASTDRITGTQTEIHTGEGVFIVRAIQEDGTTQSAKVAVR